MILQTTNRLTSLATHARNEAVISISIPKTKAQHIRHSPSSQTQLKRRFKSLSRPLWHGLPSSEEPECTDRWCGGGNSSNKPTQKGSVADRAEMTEHQKNLDTVKIGDESLDKLYTFTYLGAGTAGDVDPVVQSKNRWFKFNEYRNVLNLPNCSLLSEYGCTVPWYCQQCHTARKYVPDHRGQMTYQQCQLTRDNVSHC
jgi:hypothetical protein